ncbi:hypothetical protein [Paenibacillus thiaminolyticus]|nr:hypothetical protein [Paenibacillus thiaminolyticus]
MNSSTAAGFRGKEPLPAARMPTKGDRDRMAAGPRCHRNRGA